PTTPVEPASLGDASKAAHASCNDSGSCTWTIRAAGTVLRINPDSVVPGPTSTNVVMPASRIARTDSSHRTGLATCSTSNRRITPGSRTGCAVTLLTTRSVDAAQGSPLGA